MHYIPPNAQHLCLEPVPLMFAAAPSALPQVAGGTLRALAVTGDTRSPQSPNLPTLKEGGINVVVRDWQGLVGPAGMPPDVVKKINADVRQVLARPEIEARIFAMGGETIGSSSADFAALLAEESGKWKRVVDAAGITAD
ncbi:hypothetical protein BH11PSE7_BH11PSE7_17820 [soil metagenome]